MSDVAVLKSTSSIDRDKLDLIKQTVAKGTTDLELQLFLHACQRTGLDPLMKQIYAIKRRNNSTGKEEMSIQTGIDGYRLIADRTGQYAGSDEPTYQYGEDGGPDVASVTVYKLVGGIRCPFSCSARWNEYYQEKGPLWKKMPFLMLAKCAEALALRKAFPAELSGVYTHEEMMQADNTSLPSTKPSDILKRVEHGTVLEPSVKDYEADLKKAQVMGVDATTGPSSSTRGRQDGSLPQSHDAPEPQTDDLAVEYSEKLNLSQSVSECAATLNTIVKDQRLNVMQVTQLQDEAKAKMAQLRKAK